jgi:hypothetical protein
LVFPKYPDDLDLVFLDGRTKLRREYLGRIDLEGVLRLARPEREPGFRDSEQYVPDA